MARKRSVLQQVQRDAHLVVRITGDPSALQCGTVPKRLVRRKVSRTGIVPLLNALFR
ncbi:MAG: hypothetical protein ACREQ5_08415 [Candidatus Dormibacteria bacterium]